MSSDRISPFPWTSSQSPVNPRSFSSLAHSGQGGNSAPPGVHVQLQQAFLHSPLAADGVGHGRCGLCRERGRPRRDGRIHTERRRVLLPCRFPSGRSAPCTTRWRSRPGPARPSRCRNGIWSAPAIFRQGPVFHILTGAPVGEFNPCGVGGIAHPEGMASPAEGSGADRHTQWGTARTS